jgi:predicted acyltransferase
VHVSTTIPGPVDLEVERAAPAQVASPTAPAKPRRERLLALDVFRGMTIAGMLLVNDPGTWSAIYPPLEHAPWNGWTPTDLIFPFFLFIAGVTTHLSLQARRARGDDEAAIRHQIIRRGCIIFLLGFLVNGFPYFTWGNVPGIPDPTFLQRVVDRLYHWRIMGVLQRIGLAYMCGALLAQGRTVKQQVITVIVLLYGYWFAMTVLPVPDSGAMGQLMLGSASQTMAAWWDRLLLDWTRFGLGNHLWVSSQTWDPEGPFSTIPAIGTAMLGNLAGQWIGSKRPLSDRLNGLFGAGAIGMMVAMMWNWSFPINKSLWTSSYVLFCGGMAAVGLATSMWVIDVHGYKRWTKSFVIYGLNPMVAFVGSGVMARCIYSIFTVNYHGKPVALQSAIYQAGFRSWLEPVNASLAFAICFVLFWFAVLSALYKKNIVLKV